MFKWSHRKEVQELLLSILFLNSTCDQFGNVGDEVLYQARPLAVWGPQHPLP